MLVSLLDRLRRNKSTAPPVSRKIGNGRDQQQKNPVPAPTPDPARERVMVLLIGGQSNASNNGELYEEADDPRILNLHDGRCWIARHPLLGSPRRGASPWIAAARALLEGGAAERVVLIATAVGGSSIKSWSPPDGEFYRRMLDRMHESERAGLPVTQLLWIHGEHDAVHGTPGDVYESGLASMINGARAALGREIPAYIAIASLCREFPPHKEIRTAQRSVAKRCPNTFVALDCDTLGFEHRYDGVHFCESGLRVVADGFARAMMAEARKALSRPLA